MARLIDQARREAARQARGERQERILDAARELFSRLPQTEVSLDAVSQRAGVPKGIPEMFFGSSEELFLRVVATEVATWADDLAIELGKASRSWSNRRLAQTVATSFSERPRLTRLLTTSPFVLSLNLEAEAASSLVRLVAHRLDTVGKQVERRVRGLDPGDGRRFLWRVLLLVMAMTPFAVPQGALSLALNERAVDFLRVGDLGAELTAELELWLTARASLPASPERSRRSGR